MTELSAVSKDIYLDMLSYLKPQKSTPSVDPSSLGLKLAAKATVDSNVQQKTDFSAYYSELLNAGVLENPVSPGVIMDDIVKTAPSEIIRVVKELCPRLLMEFHSEEREAREYRCSDTCLRCWLKEYKGYECEDSKDEL